MSKIVLSPMQQDYVTKEEFSEFKDEIYEFRDDTKKRFDWVQEGFEMTNRHIDELECIMSKRFDILSEQIGSLIVITNKIAAKLL